MAEPLRNNGVECEGCGEWTAPDWCDLCVAPPVITPEPERCRYCRVDLPADHDEPDCVCFEEECQERLRLEDGAESVLAFHGL